ncbi:MAG: cysteine--tRNA ligase [bacterium]
MGDDEITIFNTLGREQETFQPADPDHVKMYVCGVTVYDDCHLGHARAYVVFDVVRRYLEERGFTVDYVENFTDVEDKIFDRAQELGIGWKELADRYIDAYIKVMDKLNIKHAQEAREGKKSPRVSDTIPEIIDHIQGLIENDHAYEVEGDVYFAVERFDDYGKLSGQDRDEMESGARVDVDERKQSPMDFALWKSVSEEERKNGVPSWESPWGQGRPGWHIECSVMSQTHLGDTLDIHGGGQDLIFPHHENEIAQSEALTGETFSTYWLHNGFVTIDDEKMSKSEGNFYTIKELIEDHNLDPMTLRYFILTRHYRSPIDFSFDRLEEAEEALGRLEALYRRFGEVLNLEFEEGKIDLTLPELAPLQTRFHESMSRDFNTAEALGYLQDWAGNWNRCLNEVESSRKVSPDMRERIEESREWFRYVLEDVLGITLESGSAADDAVPDRIKEMLEKREQARERGDYQTADELRDQIQQEGYVVEDTPQGTRVVTKS